MMQEQSAISVNIVFPTHLKLTVKQGSTGIITECVLYTLATHPTPVGNVVPAHVPLTVTLYEPIVAYV